jgi:3',5'-cyclic AMP phosphodiesterase CpdA
MTGGCEAGTGRGDARVVVVADTHLSRRLPDACANWRAVLDDLAADPPDALVHAGDISTDGATHGDDLADAAPLLADVPCPVLAVPGNHDVGDNPHPGPAAASGHALVDADRLAYYRATIGPDRGALDVGGWTVVGINAQLLGSGLAEAADQEAWLAATLAAAADRHRFVVLVLHKPLVPPPRRPHDVNPGRYVPPAARARLDDLIAGGPVRAVVTGHTHQHGTHRRAGITQVWAPSTWATLVPEAQPLLGTRAPGIVELTLAADGTAQVTIRRPAGLTHHLVDPRAW